MLFDSIILGANKVRQAGSESQETWDLGPVLPFQGVGAASALPVYLGLPFFHLQSDGLVNITSPVPCCLNARIFHLESSPNSTPLHFLFF